MFSLNSFIFVPKSTTKLYNMRKIILLLIVAYSTFSYSQNLEENKIDEFTKKTSKKTSWEKLAFDSEVLSYFRVTKIDDKSYLEIKLTNLHGGHFVVDEGPKIMFKLSNDSIYTLNNTKTTTTGIGDGSIGLFGMNAEGIYLTCFNPTDRNLKMLSEFKIIKIRLETTTRNLEYEIKNSYSKSVVKAVELVNK